MSNVKQYQPQFEPNEFSDEPQYEAAQYFKEDITNACKKLLDELLAETTIYSNANQQVADEKKDDYFYGAAYGLGIAKAIIEKKREELK
jgi:hypothetical protein